MKSLKIVCFLIPLLLLALLWVAFTYRRSTPQYILAQYPKSPAFNRAVEYHLNEKLVFSENKGFGNRRVFFSSWFLYGKPNVTVECVVDEKGHAAIYRNVHNWAIQASVGSQLKPENLTSLRSVLQALPESSSPPSLANLVIISFRDGKNWTTRIYSKADLPLVVLKVYEILGIVGYARPTLKASNT